MFQIKVVAFEKIHLL